MDNYVIKKRISNIKENAIMTNTSVMLDKEDYNFLIANIDVLFYRDNVKNTEISRLKDKITKLENKKNVLEIKQKDVTKKYENMIQAFECDFNLPFNYNDFTMFDDLRRLIQIKNERLVKDIELLQELSFGIRYGNLKIIDNGTNWRG